ncbi:uncharacterized protein LOC127799642 [Diospyros lotus]|uniref:uncharacterized protein LOC127799642 n=1 Tax=Diospyros lotus TaxID=55363 RepID=UPI00224D238E|nr:uncharacterized protein LOC127799642 [Diospyros lotus]
MPEPPPPPPSNGRRASISQVPEAAPISRSSRHTPSSSSSSLSSISSLGWPPSSPLFSPGTPHGLIPFSWESFPGIPKEQQQEPQHYKKITDASLGLLPLPPSKRFTDLQLQDISEDPFFAALVECSRDDIVHRRDPIGGAKSWNRSTVSRTLSDRLGFVTIYSSCKRACSVSDSITHLRRPRTHKG